MGYNMLTYALFFQDLLFCWWIVTYICICSFETIGCMKYLTCHFLFVKGSHMLLYCPFAGASSSVERENCYCNWNIVWTATLDLSWESLEGWWTLVCLSYPYLLSGSFFYSFFFLFVLWDFFTPPTDCSMYFIGRWHQPQ